MRLKTVIFVVVKIQTLIFWKPNPNPNPNPTVSQLFHD